MKVAPYLLPIFAIYTNCFFVDAQNLKKTPPESMEIPFNSYSWALNGQQMADLRRLSAALDSDAIVSLETCATNQGDGEYFRRERVRGVTNLLTHGNPGLDVRIFLCETPDSDKARKVYVSVESTI